MSLDKVRCLRQRGGDARPVCREPTMASPEEVQRLCTKWGYRVELEMQNEELR